MATSTLTKRLSNFAAKHGAPKGTDNALFQSFLGAAAPQIRTAFQARHSEEEVFNILNTFFEVTQKRAGNEPLVIVEETEHGTLIQSQMPDQAFIVDTVLLTLRSLGISYQAGFNLVLGIGRTKAGTVSYTHLTLPTIA